MNCSSIFTMSVFSTKVPSSFKNGFRDVSPMFRQGSNTREWVSTCDIGVSSPACSDNIEIINIDIVLGEDFDSWCDELLQICFFHILYLVCVDSEAKGHHCWKSCDSCDVEEISRAAALVNVILNYSDIVLFMANVFVFEDDKYLTNISEINIFYCIYLLRR